jgi:DNA helicase II / ATP-dependent DNA helicase PcrA
VMLTGMEDGVFPHMRALREGDPDALEEERRLAYVALTRARRKLAISYVQSRFLWGESKQNRPSEFLRSLPDEAIARHGLATARRRRPIVDVAPRKREAQWDDSIELDAEYSGTTALGRRQPGSQAEHAVHVEYDHVEYDAVEWFKGMQVRHPKFGVGTVLSWTGAGDQMKLTLVFGAARKTIMARFCQPL